jgi:tRNA (guanine10-N2)-dimethyltransferase
MGISIKKTLRQNGRSIRLVPNVTPALNSAQVIHNYLVKSHGIEIVICCDNHRTFLAQTVAVQNITRYSERDYNRPKRDARTGMLPPKLAQIMINLATGSSPPAITLLDPFCGTGVILQEALLMGYAVYGSDINPRMVEYAKINLNWLKSHFELTSTTEPVIEIKDATVGDWKNHFDVVVSELLLGPPLTKLPPENKLVLIRRRCDEVVEKFLKNIACQINSKTQLCLAIPAWQVADNQFLRLSSLDHLAQLGYNQRSFEHLNSTGLIYARSNQIVARELIIISRK